MTKTVKYTTNDFSLASGKSISPLEIAYETYGKLNKDKTNAVLICHALTGDQYACAINPITKKPGWWDILVGKGKPNLSLLVTTSFHRQTFEQFFV